MFMKGEEKTDSFGAVLVCTGMYSKPTRPFEYRMEKSFKGKISHSSEIKNVSGFKDKIVVLIGFGNSAVQLASDLAPIAKEIHISTRRGSWLLPTLDDSSEPWDISYNSRLHYYGRQLIPKYFRNWLWEIRANEKLDHVSAGIQPDHRFLATNFTFSRNGFIDYLISQRIKVKPNLLSFTEDGVEFVDKSVIEHVDEVSSS